MRQGWVSGFLATVLLIAATGTGAADTKWTLSETSRVGFTARQAGQPVEGRFKIFDAEIVFSDQTPDRNRITVTIDLASVDTEVKDRDDTLRSADFFDVRTWPTARFTAREIRRTGVDSHEAVGGLTLRDQTRDAVLAFTLSVEPSTAPGWIKARAKGGLTISRLEFGIGQGSWLDTAIVADAVNIMIDIVAEADDPSWRARLSN